MLLAFIPLCPVEQDSGQLEAIAKKISHLGTGLCLDQLDLYSSPLLISFRSSINNEYISKGLGNQRGVLRRG